MWLGSAQQLDKSGIKEIFIMSTYVVVSDTARWTSVLPSAALARPIHESYAAAPSSDMVFDSWQCQSSGPRLHFMSPWLLQLSAYWSHWRVALSTVVVECCCSACTPQCQHVTPIRRQLRWLPVLPPTHSLQAGYNYFPSVIGRGTGLPGGRLPACC